MSPITGDTRAFDFGSPVRLHFGEGLIDRLAEFCPDAQRILVVSGRNYARRSGLLDRVRRAFDGRTVEFFSEVESNPSIETVERGAAVAATARPDLIVGLGGGSALDAAKCIAVLASNGGDFRSLLGRQEYVNKPIRMMAVPTTCGTGSEANRYAIITDLKDDDKVTFASQFTYPAIGILDPSVLKHMPATLLVETACDAFTHAFEGYTSRWSQPFSDMLALEAMSLIIRHLPRAIENDPLAKSSLLYASSLAGIVIDHTGTTVLHAMGYYLTLRHGVSHGKANALFLPDLFLYLERELPDKLYDVYALFPEGMRSPEGVRQFLHGMGVVAWPSTCGKGSEDAEKFADYVLCRKNTVRTAGTVTKDWLCNAYCRTSSGLENGYSHCDS